MSFPHRESAFPMILRVDFRPTCMKHKITPLSSDPCSPLRDHLFSPPLHLLTSATPNHFTSPKSHLSSLAFAIHCCLLHLEGPSSFLLYKAFTHSWGSFPNSWISSVSFKFSLSSYIYSFSAFLLNSQLPRGKVCQPLSQHGAYSLKCLLSKWKNEE